jgi:hypothetical protein
MDYRIIGDDGKEYGPADLETLRSWASQGRVSPLTMVSRSDSGRWAHAENYAELEGFIPKRVVPSTRPPPAAAEPGTAPPGGEAAPGQLPAQPPEIPAMREAISGPSYPPIPVVQARSAFAAPGRGDTILALGLVSLLGSTVFSCLCLGLILGPATGIPAWVMGAGDLKKIDAGLIAPQERGNTKGGMICGIIGTFAGPLIAVGASLLWLVPFVANLGGY